MSYHIKHFSFWALSVLCTYCTGLGGYFFGRYFWGEWDSGFRDFWWVGFNIVITLYGFAGWGMRYNEQQPEKIWGKTTIQAYCKSLYQLSASLLVFVCAWIGGYITVNNGIYGLSYEFKIIAETPGASHVIGAIVGLLAGGSYLTLYQLESYLKPVIRDPFDTN